MRMLEKVAKALHAHWMANFDGGGLAPPQQTPWEHLSGEERAYGFGMARAALLAIREPDEATVEAGRGQMPAEAEMRVEGGRPLVRLKPPGECVSPAKPFTAMIDAILRDDEP